MKAAISRSDFRIERVRPKRLTREEYEELREAWIFVLRMAEKTKKFYKPWEDFRVFCYDIGIRPSSDHYFGKFIPKGGYFTKNCGWITKKEMHGFKETLEVHQFILKSGYLEWEPWRDVYQFINDIGPRPGWYYSFGRILMDEGFHPRNCRWMTKQQRQELGIMSKELTIRGFQGNLLRWSYVLVDYLLEEEYVRINRTKRGSQWKKNPNKALNLQLTAKDIV